VAGEAEILSPTAAPTFARTRGLPVAFLSAIALDEGALTARANPPFRLSKRPTGCFDRHPDCPGRGRGPALKELSGSPVGADLLISR